MIKFKTWYNLNEIKKYITEMDKMVDLTTKLRGEVSVSSKLDNLRSIMRINWEKRRKTTEICQTDLINDQYKLRSEIL